MICEISNLGLTAESGIPVILYRKINFSPDVVDVWCIYITDTIAGITDSFTVTKINVTCGKENFPGRINPLPDHVEDVVTCALGKVNGEPVVVVVANDPIGAGQGLKVIPAPATLRSARFEGPLSGWLPSHHALIQNERVLHEWMGLAWYLLSGRL